jgi:two-component system, NtrC family, sensor kinase
VRHHFTSMTAGLAAGITTVVVVACAAGAYLFSLHHFNDLLETERSTAVAQGQLMRAALEHQMMENDRTLIADMVQTFGREARVANVVLLDRAGIAHYSSAPLAAEELDQGSATCQACHRLPADQRTGSQVIETSGGTILRTVVPFRNKEACHACHDPSHAINGVMLLDLDVGATREAMNSDLRWMVAGTGSLALVLIVGLAGTVRVVVIRRLQRFETTARLIAQGDLARRVPAEGSDTVAWLAREFNAMADSVTGLVTEVRTERERLETIINSIDDGIVVLDVDRLVVAANDAFVRRTASPRPQVLGRCCRTIAPGMCSASECPTLACLHTRERQVRICEGRGDDGAVTWDEVHASPVYGPGGAVTHVVEVWRDISDRRAAEARLAESHRLGSLGLLASGFSHELNTPLGTVLTCVEGILKDTRDGARGADTTRIGEHAAIARDQILRCRGITQHFLRLSRGQAGAPDLVDLRRAAAGVARLIEPTARAAGVQVAGIEDGPPVFVRSDEADLQHALMNVLLNAVQATPAGGRVTLDLDAGPPVRLRVRDTGCGIAARDRQRIFEPFFGLRTGGTGLGLFLALTSLRRWGGDISVTSEPDRGSQFELLLPAPASGATRQVAS